jgi:hypothetical protein
MQNTNTARNFVLQLGSLISLYISLSAVIAVVFGVINIVYPDAAAGYFEGEAARSGIRYGIALILVFFPTYILLTRFVNQIRRQETGTYLTLTKWLIYLSLLVGSGILLGDLVTVILTFLNGELTVRFALKALTLLCVIGIALSYYVLDVRGYWNQNEKQSKLFALGAAIIALVVVILGFFHIETPAEVREMRLDEQQVMDLQNIQWKVYEYYTNENTLPVSLEEAYGEMPAPAAPEDRSAYEYSRVDDDTFELCATFAHPSRQDEYSMRPVSYAKEPLTGAYSWDHIAGDVCFERTVVPTE